MIADLFYGIPNILLFLVMSTFIIIFSVIGLYLVRRYLPLKFRYHENPVIGNISANISIIYAILVGVTALYELNNFNKGDQIEQQEASTVVKIYRSASLLPEPASSKIQEQLKEYVRTVIYEEWPELEKGNMVSSKGVDIIQQIYREEHAIRLKNSSSTFQVPLNDIAVNITNLFDQHEVRVAMFDSALNSNVWFVLGLGTFLLIVINFFYGMEFHLHIASIIGIALMVTGVMYLVIVMDRPYRGDFSVKPYSFKAALKFFENN